MSKASEIFHDEKLTEKEKSKKLKEHYELCANYCDDNQTEKNTEYLLTQLNEILSFIVKIDGLIKNKERN